MDAPIPQLAWEVSLPERIEVTKTSISYRAHSYHTKVPPEAIQPFIRAFTRPGQTVLDPFCGSGMTGVAALLENRNALLSDLSPAAVHIARNYTTYCDPEAFRAALSVVAQAVGPTMERLYRPTGTNTVVEYTTWSDVYRCPSCNGRVLYWQVMRHSGGLSGDRLICPTCGTERRKSEFLWIGEEPVESHTSSGSSRIDSHPPTSAELALIEAAAGSPIPHWTPNVAFGPEREMWRPAHEAMGIRDVAGFFTRRNLYALSVLRHAISEVAMDRVREALLFAFTACVNRASRRYQWNAKRPTNVMTGTLYVPSLRYEWNVWSLFRRKAADVLRYYKVFPCSAASIEVRRLSATDLACIEDNSVDLVFMDPPFGSNIFYADSSLLWEAWLGELMDPAAEIVVSKRRTPSNGGKTLEDYRDLLRDSFAESARVLKKDGRAILAFSNSDDRVWTAVQLALSDAGYETESAHLLSKGQPSIKGVKGVTGKERVTTFDLLLCLKRRFRRSVQCSPSIAPLELVDRIIREALLSTPQHGRRTDEIYSTVIRHLLHANHSVSGITMPRVAARCLALGAVERKGRWTLLGSTCPVKRPDFVDGYITPASELPRSRGGCSVDKPMARVGVPGGRNSAFYLAHSYHTKVPPESIIPFIEHYTAPGDVVLDPFCGSGMTGVAAAVTGRRAVLNDLSTAAVHLAWNHTRPCDPEALAAAFARLEERVAKPFSSLYGTRHVNGATARIHWMLWSTRHSCPLCAESFLLWEAIDRGSGRLGPMISCPRCHKRVRRTDLQTMGSEPAWIAYETDDGRRYEKEPDPDDVARALSFSRESISEWFPTTPVGPDREMYIRCALHLQRISSVADFYTPRNLKALALLWREILAIEDDRIRRALAFAFTNTAWHGTRMRRFNARGGQRPLTGTLYVPQLSSECNVLEVMRNKIAQLRRYYAGYDAGSADMPAILLGSATDLSVIADGSIDYIFTDPPFGSNIFYSDCNLIWESWLGRLTDSTKEAVVNRSLSVDKGGKPLAAYAQLMSAAMREMARVLKPGGWATVVFQNTDAKVWHAIRDAADEAGFTFHEAASLDRQQHSHKGYKGRSGAEDVAHFDVVLNLRKGPPIVEKKDSLMLRQDLTALIASVADEPEIAARGVQGIHAEVMRRLASRGDSNFADYSTIRNLLERRQGKRNRGFCEGYFEA